MSVVKNGKLSTVKLWLSFALSSYSMVKHFIYPLQTIWENQHSSSIQKTLTITSKKFINNYVRHLDPYHSWHSYRRQSNTVFMTALTKI